MVSRIDASAVSRYAVPLKRWSVAGLGGSLLAVSASYFVVGGELLSAEFVRFAIPVALSLFVVALGVWLRTGEFSAEFVGVVFLWSLAGGVVMGLLAGWVSLLQSVEGRRMLQPASVVLTKVAVGTLGGGLLGVYHGRLRRRTEQLAEQRNRLDEFASIVSHDLRNPMNVAQGHLELARETGERRHFEAVERAHDRMERLIEEVLALSRRGETVADPSPVSLRVVAEEAWGTVETPEMDLRVETDRRIVSDARRLRALFENLFRNAAEHGGETVVVGASEDGFFVADDGPGIPAEDRELVFEGGYSTCPEGTGFGLAIVRRIAEAHDWRIHVGEGDEGGARFDFRGVASE
ncbi:HAMP domain-containing histidine kinase [Halorussus gelatinilyticus]|uniref:histidine kinase n=1 Tax=Halorussus gelatinilyticus TaxID=2937524 RepID=A0A8U0II94_9EURY|nr:HAMP domain-containing sensor histidine kinase [Halorussus gelatinilyticus]UPV99808.1 HAMP domain-containing histidine kinase [Halorussus gelatinilyticus]